MKVLDLAGKRFGYLTVLERKGSRWGKSNWLCKCDCGSLCERTANQFSMNKNVSCGCKTKESQSISHVIHGKSGTRLHRIWKAMKTRCYNPKVQYFKYYGGKGVSVCEEWLHDFRNFYQWSIENGYKANLTIDRIDGNGDYCPENCRWVTMTVQNRNKEGVKNVE